MSAVIWSAKFAAGVVAGVVADVLFTKVQKRRSNRATLKATA